MGFYDLPKVEMAQEYLDIAFKRASKLNLGKLRNDSLRSFADREIAKMDVMKDVIDSRLDEIIKAYPSIDNLTEFYSELVKITLDVDRLKKALGSLAWARKQIRILHNGQRARIRKARSEQSVLNLKKAFMGRISSVLKQIDDNLEYLDQARKVFKSFPVIKQLPTVCIAGFPNVGKSTLLSKITTSKPEVADYAFTTKKLNLGYMKVDGKEIQLIDTPGTLARPEKMNNIERQAYLAIKYQADLVVFVFDPTDTYPVDQQEELLELIKKFRKPIILYLSKTDIADENALDYFNKYEVVKDKEELKIQILSQFS